MHSYRFDDPNIPADAGTDRAAWYELLGIQSSEHADPAPITIRFLDEKNPITRGIGGWTTGDTEELYNNIQVFKTAKPLARGTQTSTAEDGTQHTDDLILAWTNDYRGTRVFAMTLGHDTATVSDPRYLDLVTRGVLWACGKLRQDGRPAKGYG